MSLAVALAFTLLGYWPILPFAGLELLMLGVAIYLVSHSGRRRQVITFTADRVRVEKGRLRSTGKTGGGPESCQDFPRAWVRLGLTLPRRGWYPSRLTIGASGTVVAVGEFLTDEERQALKAQLDRLLVETTPQAGGGVGTEFE